MRLGIVIHTVSNDSPRTFPYMNPTAAVIAPTAIEVTRMCSSVSVLSTLPPDIDDACKANVDASISFAKSETVEEEEDG
jgi:hypothetical protein